MALRRMTTMWILMLSMMTLALACDGGTTAPKAGLSLSVAAATLEPGESLRIGVTPASAGPVAWTTTDPAVAQVSGDGVVTAVDPGVATIVATRQGRSAQVAVTVAWEEVDAAAALAFEDGFEAGEMVSSRRDGYRWRSSNSNPDSRVSVSSDIAHTGTRSLKFLFGGSASACKDAWAEQRFELGEELREVWFEYYIYFPDGSEGVGPRYMHRQPMQKGADGACTTEPSASSNNKFFALWDTIYDKSKGGAVRVFFETRRSEAGADGDAYLYGLWGTDTRTAGNYNRENGRWDPAVTDRTRGRWVQIRIHARVADSKEGANGVLELWADGVRRISMRELDLAPEVGGARYFRYGYVLGWSNAGFDESTPVYVDDFKIFRANPGWR